MSTPAPPPERVPESPPGVGPSLPEPPRGRTSRVGLVFAFLLGVLVGFVVREYGGPTFTGFSLPGLAATPTPTAVATARQETEAGRVPPSLLDTLIAQTRHFKGSPTAPVVMIEFSDFQ